MKIEALRHKMARSILFTLLCTIYLFPTPTFAQQLSLSISPPLVEAVMKPGKSIVIAYTVANLGDPLIVSAQVRSFKPRDMYGSIELADELEGPARFNLENSTIKLGKQFFLKPQEGQQLLLKIRLPDGTPEGDYYYTFYVQNDLGRPEEGSTAAQTQALVGSNILITVTESGAVDVKGSIGEFSLMKPKNRAPLMIFGKTFPIYESTDEIPVKLVVQNTGKNAIKPHGDISLRGNFGERAEFQLLPENILSQSSRLIHASPSAGLTNSSLNLKGFYVGKYTLTAKAHFGNPADSDSDTITFYAVPFKLIAALGMALLFGWAIVKKFRQDEPS
jgi:hypothetical protein